MFHNYEGLLACFPVFLTSSQVLSYHVFATTHLNIFKEIAFNKLNYH